MFQFCECVLLARPRIYSFWFVLNLFFFFLLCYKVRQNFEVQKQTTVSILYIRTDVHEQNRVDSDQTPPNAVSDQSLHCLPFRRLQTGHLTRSTLLAIHPAIIGSEMDLFKI